MMTKTITNKLLATVALSGAVAGVGLTPSQALAAGWYNCKPVSVFEHDGQFQVSCSNAYDDDPTVTWVAINLTDYNTQQKARFWSAATSSLLSGRTFRVFITDTDCGFATCRLATSWSIFKF